MDGAGFFGPASGSTRRPQDIIVYVGGADNNSRYGTAAIMGLLSSVSANIYAQNGTISLYPYVTATGALFGKMVRLGIGTKLSLASAFAGVSTMIKSASTQGVEITPAAEAPVSYELMQNYPNPFNPTTSIRYSLPVQAHVTLTVYDLLGREVTRLVDEAQNPGYHETRWSGNNSSGNPVSTGIYFYRITAGQFTDVRKMMLMK
jgi:hypothetical protein